MRLGDVGRAALALRSRASFNLGANTGSIGRGDDVIDDQADDGGMSQAEVSRALGLCRQTVAHIEERGLAKLRRLLVLEREAEATRQRGKR